MTLFFVYEETLNNIRHDDSNQRRDTARAMNPPGRSAARPPTISPSHQNWKYFVLPFPTGFALFNIISTSCFAFSTAFSTGNP